MLLNILMACCVLVAAKNVFSGLKFWFLIDQAQYELGRRKLLNTIQIQARSQFLNPNAGVNLTLQAIKQHSDVFSHDFVEKVEAAHQRSVADSRLCLKVWGSVFLIAMVYALLDN